MEADKPLYNKSPVLWSNSFIVLTQRKADFFLAILSDLSDPSDAYHKYCPLLQPIEQKQKIIFNSEILKDYLGHPNFRLCIISVYCK